MSFTHASRLPYGDDYELIPVPSGRQPLTLISVVDRHNEHRIPIPKLALYAILPACGHDYRLAATAVPVCLGIASAVLAVALARARGRWT